MKTISQLHRLLTAFAALAASALACAAAEPPPRPKSPESAAPAEKKAEPSALFRGATKAALWQSAAAADERIAAALAAGKLDGVDLWAETIHLAAHAMEHRVTISDAERAKQLKDALSQASKIADLVLDGANHHDLDKTAGAHRRLRAALDQAKSLLPQEILDAPPQQLRFAKSAGVPHAEKNEPDRK